MDDGKKVLCEGRMEVEFWVMSLSMLFPGLESELWEVRSFRSHFLLLSLVVQRSVSLDVVPVSPFLSRLCTAKCYDILAVWVLNEPLTPFRWSPLHPLLQLSASLA